MNVDQAAFEAMMSKFQTSVETEKDTEYSYESFLNEDGEMIGLISYHSFRDTTYTLYREADIAMRDLLDLPHSLDVGNKIYRMAA